MNMQAFRDALFDPSHPLPEDVWVRPGADAAHRFSVHRNNVLASLVDALATTFPVALALVGEAFFRATASAFVRRSPPTSPVLGEYGGAFPEFLASFPPAQLVVYLADVARLEWLRQAALCAADAMLMDVEQLQCLLVDTTSLLEQHWRLHPSVGLLHSDHPVFSIWAAHQHDDGPQVHQALARIQHRPEAALVVRQAEGSVVVVSISAAEALFLQALQNNSTLPQAIEFVIASEPLLDVPRTLAMLFKQGVFLSPSIQPRTSV
jgi:hypothetical protein